MGSGICSHVSFPPFLYFERKQSWACGYAEAYSLWGTEGASECRACVLGSAAQILKLSLPTTSQRGDPGDLIKYILFEQEAYICP